MSGGTAVGVQMDIVSDVAVALLFHSKRSLYQLNYNVQQRKSRFINLVIRKIFLILLFVFRIKARNERR